ncbi:hypothetical protein K7X08_026970 [Anisodus acutangulus]|uniref:Uncharacterized protein n=1 Tax=Anisodus acutangulus TaxID=402998 RepID=A0A9Q1QXY2_9SOLA|nr:hypothetical protein K7X08_026970 [Anisodus acutangulus]
MPSSNEGLERSFQRVIMVNDSQTISSSNQERLTELQSHLCTCMMLMFMKEFLCIRVGQVTLAVAEIWHSRALAV